MNPYNEMPIPEDKEILHTAVGMEQMQNLETAAEQIEMEMHQMEVTESEKLEQQEMDTFAQGEKLGGRKLIYYPDGEIDNKKDNIRLGEYRIFADTRPSGSKYDVFADNK